jgi:acyl carrier protein
MRTMSKEEIFIRLSEVLVETFDLSPGQLQPTAHLIDDLDLDSIDLIDLVVRLQEETDLDLVEEELKQLQLIQDVVDLVYRKLGS